MATGVAGSTLTSEMNRVANGGTYPAMTAYKALVGAANAWAGTSGLGLIGALNIKADSGRQPNNYKGLNAVCNEIAGTSGLSAVDALRSIDL
ncbi:hypothetical protein uvFWCGRAMDCOMC440_051 [Freshwater phage uvFW-CGR-AMD-COM-C440]|jgi:hypothetical protein|nr:hypothetical protein uvFWCGRAMDCOMC440_051 [Freshwater phage uvFW-CGR-AMD-COM-C440]